ncbi:hypothetical protein SAMN04490243_0062 [Robiginitalea myxolifaciens]|uniref:DUF3379 domain-containing protein n=1 Tax=Robiginitalea myxolifaciens TaxID=400055 RepID=A0A1I6FMP6_9FLAO|nr:hypothetical protein [Robiginitalea myxolifaciens]SFR31235.1 hypothetical protein SAMN04490243_0062 [Robiginitalea myxolifaciens]
MKQHSRDGFKTPDKYFENFQEQLGKRLNAEDSDGFSVPEGFFESFGEKLEQRLTESPGKVRKLRPQLLAWSGAVAAAIILFVVLQPGSNYASPTFSDLADAEIENYLEVGYEDLSAYEWAENFPPESLSAEDLIEVEPAEEQLLDYLDQDPDALEELFKDTDNE